MKESPDPLAELRAGDDLISARDLDQLKPSAAVLILRELAEYCLNVLGWFTVENFG